MALTQDQIAHIAKLSRLHLAPELLEKYGHSLTEVVDYIDMLEKVPTESLAQVNSSASMIAPLRQDEVHASEASQKELLSTTAQKVIASQIALPNIMS